MKISIVIAILIVFLKVNHLSAQTDTTFTEYETYLKTQSGEIFGKLTIPENAQKVPVALIIAGSGPTDRDGNNPMMKNDALKKLAHQLALNNIASLRFDKRGIAASKEAMTSEADLRFENYVEDVKAWINQLKQDERFSKVVIIGHSEGSLIGMLAAEAADQYVSIAGVGRSADLILKEQLREQTQAVKDMTFPIIDSLKSGKTVYDVNPMLYSLFRPDVQPYLISWFKYNPQEEIKKVSVPVLIIQGTNDIQVAVKDAQYLAEAKPETELALIENMNHIFRIVEGDKEVNIATYNNASLPISEEMVQLITEFINSN